MRENQRRRNAAIAHEKETSRGIALREVLPMSEVIPFPPKPPPKSIAEETADSCDCWSGSGLRRRRSKGKNSRQERNRPEKNRRTGPRDVRGPFCPVTREEQASGGVRIRVTAAPLRYRHLPASARTPFRLNRNGVLDSDLTHRDANRYPLAGKRSSIGESGGR